MRSTLAILSAITLLAGCNDAAPSPEPVPSPPPAAEEAPAPLDIKDVMQAHAQHAIEARDALIRGDIETATDAVNWLASHQHADAFPEGLRPMLANMQAAARRFTQAESLTARSEAFALMLTGCGDCHRSMSAGPSYEVPELPAGDGIAAHMQRHRWAANRMWEGLVQPSEDNFQNALGVLSDVPLHPDDIGTGSGSAAQIRAIAEEVHHLAEETIDAEDDAAKAALYGRFIASCAGCHHLLGQGPTEEHTSAPE